MKKSKRKAPIFLDGGWVNASGLLDAGSLATLVGTQDLETPAFTGSIPGSDAHSVHQLLRNGLLVRPSSSSRLHSGLHENIAELEPRITLLLNPCSVSHGIPEVRSDLRRLVEGGVKGGYDWRPEDVSMLSRRESVQKSTDLYGQVVVIGLEKIGNIISIVASPFLSSGPEPQRESSRHYSKGLCLNALELFRAGKIAVHDIRSRPRTGTVDR